MTTTKNCHTHKDPTFFQQKIRQLHPSCRIGLQRIARIVQRNIPPPLRQMVADTRASNRSKKENHPRHLGTSPAEPIGGLEEQNSKLRLLPTTSTWTTFALGRNSTLFLGPSLRRGGGKSLIRPRLKTSNFHFFDDQFHSFPTFRRFLFECDTFWQFDLMSNIPPGQVDIFQISQQCNGCCSGSPSRPLINNAS